MYYYNINIKGHCNNIHCKDILQCFQSIYQIIITWKHTTNDDLCMSGIDELSLHYKSLKTFGFLMLIETLETQLISFSLFSFTGPVGPVLDYDTGLSNNLMDHICGWLVGWLIDWLIGSVVLLLGLLISLTQYHFLDHCISSLSDIALFLY